MPSDDFVMEESGDISPGTAGGSVRAQRASWFYFYKGLTARLLQDLMPDVLGQTATAVRADGKISRFLPMQHPMLPWLYASNISSLVGWGGGEAFKDVTNAALPEGGRAVSGFLNFPVWRVGIDFTNRPYPVAADERIVKQTAAWHYEGDPPWPNDTSVFPPPIDVPCVNEWDRWTDLDHDPKEEAVSAQQGTMKFVSTESGEGKASGQGFPGQPRMVLPNQLVKLVWYEVPYRYAISDNSYFSKWIGRVNQNAVKICGRKYLAGELLYLGWRPTKYRQPGTLSDTLEELKSPAAFYNSLLADFEFTFLYTRRPGTDITAGAVNPNFVRAGHNLLPWVIDRRFHYAQTVPQKGTPANGWPSFFSFPLEVLQYDPDAADALQIASYP